MIGLLPAALFWLAVAAMAVAGLMNALTNGPIFALFQATVDPGMQGRVFSVIGSLCSLASPLGLALAGPVADALGVGSWFLVYGVCSLLMAGVGLSVPALVNLGEGQRQPQPAPQEAVPA